VKLGSSESGRRLKATPPTLFDSIRGSPIETLQTFQGPGEFKGGPRIVSSSIPGEGEVSNSLVTHFLISFSKTKNTPCDRSGGHCYRLEMRENKATLQALLF
jgi:hypothetical protein